MSARRPVEPEPIYGFSDVKVFGADGKLKRVISSAELAKRHEPPVPEQHAPIFMPRDEHPHYRNVTRKGRERG